MGTSRGALMIEAMNLTKRYGRTVAVDELSFSVRPGRVTGFLGPNGAGKSTTMRLILGLDSPDAGNVTVNGKSYRSLREPLRVVGALLDARWVHPNRSARAHLRGSPDRMLCRRVGWTRYWGWWGCRRLPGVGSAVSRWGCRSGWVSRPRCSGIRRCCCSTSR